MASKSLRAPQSAPQPTPPAQKKQEDLLDIALGGSGALSCIAGARVVIRGVVKQIFVLTGIGNEDLQGFVAHGIAHPLIQVDHDLEAAMDSACKGGE